MRGTYGDDNRKPLAKVDGKRRVQRSGLTIARRGTPNLDDWVAFIANGSPSKKLILAPDSSERRITLTHLLAHLEGMSKGEIHKLAKG